MNELKFNIFFVGKLFWYNLDHYKPPIILIKKFTIRLKLGLYDKLKEYAKDNFMTVNGALIHILNQFLNKK